MSPLLLPTTPALEHSCVSVARQNEETFIREPKDNTGEPGLGEYWRRPWKFALRLLGPWRCAKYVWTVRTKVKDRAGSLSSAHLVPTDFKTLSPSSLPTVTSKKTATSGSVIMCYPWLAFNISSYFFPNKTCEGWGIPRLSACASPLCLAQPDIGGSV